MTSKGENNKHLADREVQHDDLINDIIPDARFNCVGIFRDPLDKNDINNNRQLCNCIILEIITNIFIDVNSLIKTIKKAGFRLLDATYSPDEFHFLVRKIEYEGM